MSVKKMFLPSFILLIVAFAIALLPTDKEGAIYTDTLRLHILAESDSEEDQRVKLKIRDAVLLEYGEELKNSGYEEAVKNTGERLGEIEDFVNRELTDLGYGSTASVSLSEEWYDTRVYEDFTLPCGYYTSLRIVIGSGAGQNWWCVMYPPLCLDLATETAPPDDAAIDYSSEEIALISKDGYNIKFKLLEIFSSVFQK